MSDYQIKVGPRTALADGTDVELRGDKTGAQVTTDAHGRYREPASRRNLFILDSDAVTAAAANATKSANGTIKLINGFYNPIGSGFNASITRIRVATTSGTPAGPYFLNMLFLSGTLTSARTGTIRSALLSNGTASSAMFPLVNVAVAVTPADTTAFQQLCTLGGPAAIAAGAGLYGANEELAGEIEVPPGCCFGLTCSGAGTSHVLQSSMWWEEIAIG